MATGFGFRRYRSQRSLRTNKQIQTAIEALEPRRLLSTGLPDPTFGANGFVGVPTYGPVNSAPVASAVESNGDVVTVTLVDTDLVVSRFTAGGALDTSFGNRGSFRSDVMPGFGQANLTVAVAPDGDVIAVGTDGNDQTDIFDLTSSGTLNPAFGTGGVESLNLTGGGSDVFNQLGFDPSGNVYLAGYVTPSDSLDRSFGIIKFNATGTLNLSFDSTAQNTIANQFGNLAGHVGSILLAVSGDGQVALATAGAGKNYDAVVWLNGDGSPNVNFNYSHAKYYKYYKQPAHIGEYNAYYNAPQGEIPNMTVPAHVFFDNQALTPTAIAFDSQDRLVVAGDSAAGPAVARFVSGANYLTPYDTTFNGHSDGVENVQAGEEIVQFNNYQAIGVSSLSIQGDGNDIALGFNVEPQNSSIDKNQLAGVALLNGDGSLNGSFNPAPGVGDLNSQGLPSGEEFVYAADTYTNIYTAVSSIGFTSQGVDLVSGIQPEPIGALSPVQLNQLTLDGAVSSEIGYVITSQNAINQSSVGPEFGLPLDGHEAGGKLVEVITTDDLNYATMEPDTYLVQFNPNGSLDAAFGNGGYVQVNAPNFTPTAMTIAPNGDIYLAGGTESQSTLTGGEIEVVSYDGGDGSINDSFNGSGTYVITPTTVSSYSAIATGVAVTASGDDVVVSAIETSQTYYNRYTVVAELSSGDGLDTSFHAAGPQPGVYTLGNTFMASSVAIDPSGNVDLGGVTSDYSMAVVQLTSSGTLNTAFDSAGAQPGEAVVDFGNNYSTATVDTVTTDSAGNVIVGGGVFDANSGVSDLAVAEITSSGLPDPAFNGTGTYAGELGNVEATATGAVVDSTGNIFVSGFAVNLNGIAYSYTGNVSEFTSGFPNESFGNNGVVTTSVNGSQVTLDTGLTIDSSDRVVAAGVTLQYGIGYEAFLQGYLKAAPGTTTSTGSVSVTYGGTVDLSASVISPGFTVDSGSVTFDVLNAEDQTVATISAPVTNNAAGASLSLAGIDAGSYTVSASYSDSSSTFGASSATNVLTIQQATSSVSATASNVTYTGSAYSNSDVTPVLNGPAVNDGTYSYAYYDSSNHLLGGAPTNAGSYSVIVTWSGDVNYSSSSSAPAPFTIAQATPTVSATAANIKYNALAYPNSDVSPTLTGPAVNDGTYAYAYYDFGNHLLGGAPTNAGNYSVIVTWSGDANFTSAGSAAAPFTILQATPTVSASAASVTYSDGQYPNSDVSVSVTGVNNASIADGSVSYVYYDSSHNQLSSAPTNAGSYSVVATFSGDANYTSASSAPAPFTIGKATPAVTASATTITYTGMAYPNSDVTVSVTGIGNATISDGSVSLTYFDADNDPLSGPPTIAGSYTVVATFSGDANYSPASSSPAPFVINPVINSSQAVVTAVAADVTYNGSAYPNVDVTVMVVGAGDAPITDGSISFTYFDSSDNELSGPPTNAGSYSVVANWSGDGTYAPASSSPAPFTINQATATVTLSNLNQTYSGSPESATVATAPNGLAVSVTYNGSPTAPINAGSYSVVATVNNPNYQGVASGTLVIARATATVSLSNLTQTYSGSPESATVSTTPNGLTVSVTYNGSATAPTNAGSYAVLATVTSENYQGTSSGTLVINKAAASVTLSSLNQTYSGLPESATAATTPAGLSVGFTYNGSPTAPTNAGSYAVVASITNPNYQGTASGTLVIARANLTVTVGNATRAYGAANPGFSSVVTGLYSGDGITESYSTTATAASPIGNYTINVTLVDPNNRLPNYNVTITPGTLTVIKANLTIAANPQTKTYGSANPTLTGSIIGVQNGDNIAATYSTTAVTGSPIGSYPITVTVNDPTHKLSNYNLTVTNSTLTVTKATLTITANNETKTYGSGNPTLSISYSGFANGDTPAVLTSQPTATTTATVSSNVGVYPITVSGAAAANYAITYVSGALQVTPATLYVLVDPTIKFVGRPDPNFNVVYIGFVLGQNASVLSGTLIFTTSATTNSPVGLYLVYASGLTSSNYNITYVPGILLEL